MLNEFGYEANCIAALFDIHPDTVCRWISRQDGCPDCFYPPRQQKCIFDKEAQDRIIAFYCQTTMLPSGHGRWSFRTAETFLANNPDELGISPSCSTIHRILSNHMIKPHKNKYFLHISDPGFFPKMEHLIELKNNSPKHLYYFDESPGIQVLQRLAPTILAGKSEPEIRTWLKEFEYIRNGTVDLFAFQNSANGQIYCECRADHGKETFHDVFRSHVNSVPQNEKIHYVMDNLATHTTYEFCDFIAELCNVQCPVQLKNGNVEDRRKWLQSDCKRIVIHYTPFHGSWLNAVEVWFSIIARTCLKESYSSPDELKQAIEEFSELWNKDYARPLKWDYDGQGLHQKVIERFILFLERPATEWHNRFMNKQFELICNLLDFYRQEVAEDVWNKFMEKIQASKEKLADRISQDPKPKRRAVTMKSFDKLLKAVQNINTHGKSCRKSSETKIAA